MKINELISKINLPTKASVAYLGASILGKSIGLITTPFFTRLISRDEYGKLTLYMTILGGASIICSAISSSSAVYRGFKLYENKKGEFVKSTLLVSIGFSVIISLALFCFLGFFRLDRSLFIPLALQIICDSIVGFSLAKARYYYKYGEVMLINILSSALPALVSLIILGKFGGGFVVRIYSLLFVSIIVAAWQVIRLLRSRERISKGIVTNIIKTSMPLLPHSFSVAISGQMDKLFITALMGSAALSSYSVAHSLGISMQFAVTALGASLGPWLIRKIDEGGYERIGEVVSTIFSLFCAIALGLCAISPELMNILAPDSYIDALPAIAPISLSVPLGFLSYVITVGLVQVGRGRYTALISLSSLGVCFILNYALIPPLGYFGAGLALLLSQAVGVGMGLWFMRKSDLAKTFLPKRVFSIFLFSIGIAVMLSPFYGFLYLRVFILVVPTIMLLNSLLHSKQLITE